MAITTHVANCLANTSTRSNGLKVLLAVSIYYLYKYRSNAVGTRRRPDLKGLKYSLPLVGDMIEIARVPLDEFNEFIEKKHEEHGDIWTFTLPGVGRFIQINNPDILEPVFKSHFHSYEKGRLYRDFVSEIAGDGINTADGAEWKYQRQLTSKIFDTRAFKDYTSDTFVVLGKHVLDILGEAADNGTIIDLQDIFMDYTLETFGHAIFGESFGLLTKDTRNEKNVAFAASFNYMLEVAATRIPNPFWATTEVLNGTTKAMQARKNILRGFAKELLDKRIKEGPPQNKRKDLLQYLMEGVDNHGNPLTETLILDNVTSFIIAGRDTTSNALTWMLYLLLREGEDKTNLERVYKEIDEVLQNEDPDYSSIKKLKFTEACFKETLRVKPAIPRNIRYCIKDDILPDGTKVYAGEYIGWCSYAMGRSEAIWGSTAKKYFPQRWLDYQKQPSLSKFNAFHLGPRMCLGQQFAFTESMTIISMMFQKFEFELEEPARIAKYLVSITYPMAGGLRVRVKRRSGDVAVAL